MGTRVHVVVQTTDGGRPGAELLDLAEDCVRVAEQRWSRFLPDSELSRINRLAGRVTVVTTQTFDLVDLALTARWETNGSFDPTVGSALVHAGYDDDFDAIAARPEPFGSMLGSFSGPDQIVLDRRACTVLLAPGTVLDLGGIAKGHVADGTTDELLKNGASSCCVNIGGDIRVAGPGPVDGVWRIEVAPAGVVVRLSAGAVCTSSTTKRRWLSLDGPAHHLIDPLTGRSRVGGPQSVTAIASTATAAEVITKWMMAGGRPGRFEATGFSSFDDGTTHAHPGLEPFLDPAGTDGQKSS